MNTIPTEACRSDAERFGLTQCAECGHLLHQDEVVPVVYYLFQQQIQEHACSETCREKWLNDMRKAGL